MIAINKNPSRRDLLIFAALLPVFFGMLGTFRWYTGAPRTAIALWFLGLAMSLLAFAVPPARRWLYIGWMYAVYPIAWTVSHLILAVMYFAVATPIALVLRMLGHDPMLRRFDKAAKSYWVVREQRTDSARYFRQF